MRLWHTTLVDNLPGIYSRGILTAMSQGKMRAVWVHALEQRSWAFLHTIKRHGGRIEDVISLEVDVPDEWVRRSSADGLFYVKHDVPPSCIVNVVEFRTVAASPLAGRKGKSRGSLQ